MTLSKVSHFTGEDLKKGVVNLLCENRALRYLKIRQVHLNKYHRGAYVRPLLRKESAYEVLPRSDGGGFGLAIRETVHHHGGRQSIRRSRTEVAFHGLSRRGAFLA